MIRTYSPTPPHLDIEAKVALTGEAATTALAASTAVAAATAQADII